MTHPLQSAQAAQRPIHSAWSRSHPMMKSRQTVAQQSHRRGIAFGARPHRAKRSLSLLAKVKQTTRRFRLIFEVGAADPFLQIEIKKERHSTRSRAVACASCGRGDPDGKAEDFAGICLIRELGVAAGKHSHRHCAAPLSNLRIITKL